MSKQTLRYVIRKAGGEWQLVDTQYSTLYHPSGTRILRSIPAGKSPFAPQSMRDEQARLNTQDVLG